ncbi:MAG: MarR family winged helix-turn-helix transcriptional regulator [Variibacter sp.]
MTNSTPSKDTVAAWARLMRVQQVLLANVEAELKTAGFPPLAWYDALLELSRLADGKMRPLDLEKSMLFPQYGMSRLIDRMERAGLVAREACPGDGRGQMVAITAAGRALQKKMWPAYAASIERHIGAKISSDEARRLEGLLRKIVECPTTLAACSGDAPRKRRN